MVTQKQALEALDRFAWHMGRPHHPDAAILREYIKQDAAAPNLAMMVRRLCSRMPDGAPRITDKTRADALALLAKHGLLGNGLRETEATPQQEKK